MAARRKSIGIFALTMINLAAIMSLRNFTLMAPYGLGMVALFAIAILCFFIPTALISAELASTTAEEGGAYVWIKNALGAPVAFFCEWISFVTTIASITMTAVFLTSSMALTMGTAVSESHIFVFFGVVATVWTATFLSMRGVELASRIVTISTVVGAVVPSAALILLAAKWVLSGREMAISLSAQSLCPNLLDFSNISFLAGLMFAFAGIEMSSYYIRDVRDPKRTFPRAVLISAALILIFFVLGSLSIAIAVPHDQIRIEAGAMQAIAALLGAANSSYLVPVFGFLIIFGAIAYIFAWISGPVRGLYAVRHAGFLPLILQKTDSTGLPVTLMLVQAAFVTVFAAFFLFAPSTSLCFWIINVSSSVLMLLFYACLFLSGAILRRRRSEKSNGHIYFSVPGGFYAVCALAAVGLVNVAFCVAVSFFLPIELFGQMSQRAFAMTVAGTSFAMGCPPALFMAFRKPHWKCCK
jgi:amino acid transporter